MLRKLLKALQNGKNRRYSSSDYKRKGYGHHHYKRKHKKFFGSS
ncbi:hypothetical protein [Bacillus paralicheniformis]|nr:hypothetical protein [Bacillus paralicheniformis]